MSMLDISFTAGQLNYTTNTTLTDSIKDPRLFDLAYWLLGPDGCMNNTGFDHRTAGEIYNNDTDPLAPPLSEGLFFAKVL